MKTNSLIPERRQGFRILTVKNVRNAAIVVATLFVVVSVISELRDTTSGRYGRLYGKEVSKAASPLAKPDAVPDELPTVSEQTYADPTLLEPAKREAYLGVTELTADATAIPTPVQPRGEIAISGDATTGIQVSATPVRHKPVLSGGFGR